MQTTNFSLEELLRRAREEKLRIPQFQRPFIWRESQIKLLVDSMLRAYPIGSLLLLDKTSDLTLASRSISAAIREEREEYVLGAESMEADEEDAETFILDGQQRTTSIARVFLDAHPKKRYYFDLKLILKEHRLEEASISWIRSRGRGETNPDRKDRNRLIRADVILEQQKADVYVSEYVEDSGDFPEFENDRRKEREAVARIKGIFETIRNYKIPVVTLERTSGIASVCRVFETINSTGTRLTTFDLAVARFYPKPDLRDLWETALKNHPILEKYEAGGEEVLQVIYLTTSARERKYPNPTRSNLLQLSNIEDDWEKSSLSLAETYDWAKRQGARTEKLLPSRNVLVAMAAVRNLHRSKSIHEIWRDHDFIRRWYFSKIMQAGASQASNYRISLDFMALRGYVEDGAQPKVQEVKLSATDLVRMRPSDVRYKALQNMFATTIMLDLVSGDTINSESAIHDHHIFPRNSGKRYSLPSAMLDSISNRVPILGKSNQELGDSDPKEYFGRLMHRSREQGTLGGFTRRLEGCMIPGDPREPGWLDSFSEDKFEEFCRQRAALIIARVREIVGDSLRDTSPDDESPDYED